MLEVWAVTDYRAAAACPDCGTVSGRVHETLVTRPRGVRRAADPVDLRWVKFRWKCEQRACDRKTFTEQLPPGCRITTQLRAQAAAEVTERGVTPAEAARHAGISWPVVHGAFAATADPVLDQPALPVTHLGVDEHRRGRARFALLPPCNDGARRTDDRRRLQAPRTRPFRWPKKQQARRFLLLWVAEEVPSSGVRRSARLPSPGRRTCAMPAARTAR